MRWNESYSVGPNQIVHGRVLDDEVLAARLLRVDHPADQDAGIADDESARLQNQLAPGRFTPGTMTSAKALAGRASCLR